MKNNILKSIFVSLLLIVGASNAWAVDHTGGYIYFLKPSTWTESKVMMFIGHDSYTSVYEMTKVSNTDNLYRYTMPSWGGANYVAFANAGSVWGSGNWGSSNRTNAPHYTNVYKDYGFNSGSYYIIVPASTSNNANITINYKNSAANLNLTTKAIASNKAHGTVSVSGYYMSNATTASTRSAVSSTSSNATASTTLAPGSTATFKATASTGYEFVGWYDAATGGNQLSTSTTYTYKYDISYTGKTVYGRFKAKEYTVTLNQENATTTGTTSVTATYGVTMPTIATLPTRNGYDFAGYFDAKSGGTKYYNADGSSAKNWDKTAATTLYAQWTAKDITINWNANGGSVTPTSSTYTYDGDAITLPTPSYAGHRFLGWFTAANGGTQITDVGTTNKPYTTVTYYAHWEVSIVEHKVTFGVGTGYTSYGTLTAATSSGNISSGANIVEGTSVTFTATPNTGYEVEGWYTNAACTEGKHNAGQTTYTTSITGITNVYVKIVEKTWSVTFAAGTGGTIAEPASSPKTVGEVTGVTIIAKASTGYTFSGWTSSNGGKFDDSKSEKTTFKPTAATTVTANFNENLYAITVNSNNENFGTVSPESGTAGIDTKFTIIATPKLGYKFVSWKTDAGITVADSESQETTVNATAAGTITANFELIPPTTLYIRSNGNFADFKWNYNSVAYDMEKVDCDGTYYTANVLGGIDEITITGSNNFTTTTLTVPTDGKTLYDISQNLIYLKPNANWKADNARFAAAFLNSDKTTTQWVSMTSVGNDIYSCAIPDGSWKYVIFCRMNPSAAANNWDNKWNQTSDLEIPTDAKNLYTVKSGTWDKGGGEWSAHYDNSRWTTFEAPTLPVTINITGKGSIVIDGETYSSNTTGKESFAFTKITSESITISDITAAERWAYNNDAKITMCNETNDLAASHTINGPATINLSFTQTSCEVVFNLNLPKGVVIPSWSIANQYMDINGTATEPSVGEIGDYLFGGWYKNGSTFTDANKYDFSTPVTGDLNLYARWIPYAQCIFFKNTLSWSDVYVYTFSADAWDSYVGLKVKGKYQEYGKMTQIGQTDVYYYTLNNTTDGFSYIAFSETDMHNNNEFYGSKAIYRGDRSDQMQLFIPQTDQFPSTTNKTQYYSSGIWMKYNSTESGYKWSSDKNGWSTDVNPFTASTKGGYTFTTTVSLSGNTTYLFKINNIKNDWFGNTGTMTQDNCTKWPFTPDTDNATIKPNVTGDYVFTVYLGDGKVEVSLEYPLSVGDYRLSYYDAVTGLHPGHYIKKRNEDRRDTVSFFVHVENNPEIRLESCTAIDANTSTATWEILDQYEVLKTISANPATAMLPGKRKSDGTLYIGEGCGIDSTGVYNFILQQSNSTAEVITDETHPYEGKYYIRTDAAAGGWDSFRQAGNKMTYSSYADKNQDFDHYFCKWITQGTNIKFVIANEYSLCISDTLDGDDIVGNTGEHIGYLPADANVRFGWDGKTNEVSRAYISGSGKSQDRFLVLTGNEYLLYVNGDSIPQGTEADSRLGLNEHELLFSDKQNWIYQLDVKANSNTEITLTAQYNKETQTFFSTSKSGEVMQATNDDYHKVRMIYDFKTNNLIAAWLLDTPVQETEAESVASNMLIIRENQDDANQINFTKNQNMEIYTAYAVMTFTRDWVKGADTRDRSEYWVSFPFDVNLSDVFGFSEYGDQWIMLLYDGAERAEKGYWKETTTFWKYITNRNYTLKAGVGYVLKLNPNKMNFDYGATDVSLFFPSQGIPTIINAKPTSITVPAHTCTIERDNRNIYDSHWNLIGVPGYANLENLKVDKLNQTVTIENEAHNLAFYYAYDAANNSYNTSLATATFKNMHAYMVQYAGELAWTNIQETPASIAARRNSDAEPEKAIFRLELAQGEEKADQTFVQMQQEGATADFDMNVDMTKIFNSGANIYTLVGSQCIQTAGNALPFSQTVVPVGVVIATDGEYTFRMPDGTEGMIVELIDYETNTRTNLLLNDYTVNLPVGTNEKRFAISIKPNKVATSIDSTTTPSDSNIRKFIIDGKLYLQKDGMLYDAQGKLVR